jgi:hypothetical protein
VSRSFRRNRLIAFIAAFAMITVICGFLAHGFTAQAGQADHSDWSMHFTGVAGSAPKPSPIIKPVFAAWLAPLPAPAQPRSARRLRGHSARGPPASV